MQTSTCELSGAYSKALEINSVNTALMQQLLNELRYSEREHAVIESITTYTIAIVVLSITALVSNAPVIMTLGGLVLLGLRLYVDGKRALRIWKGND